MTSKYQRRTRALKDKGFSHAAAVNNLATEDPYLNLLVVGFLRLEWEDKGYDVEERAVSLLKEAFANELARIPEWTAGVSFEVEPMPQPEEEPLTHEERREALTKVQGEEADTILRDLDFARLVAKMPRITLPARYQVRALIPVRKSVQDAMKNAPARRSAR